MGVRRTSGLMLAALLVPGTAAAVDVGDVVITELMIEARSDSGEWIEVYATGDEVDLAGCFLRQIGDGGGGQAVLLDGLIVGAGEFALLSRQDPCVSYDAEGLCAVPADFIYDSVSLTNGGGEVRLECGTTRVDTVVHDWPAVEEDCRTVNSVCSVNLSPDSFGGDGPAVASANDDWANWCVPPASSFGLDAIGLESISTPGAINVCPEPGASCGPGDAAFTELMIRAPNAQREWFELLVTSPTGCDLQGCVLQEGPDADPFLGPTEAHWDFHTIDAPGNIMEVGAGEYALFAKGELGVGTLAGGELVSAVNIYSGISFGDTEPGYLHLLCGGQIVDSAPYDWGLFEDSCPEEGCSVGVVSIYENTEGNDHLGRWCIPPQEPVWMTPEALPFRGTPGGQGVCDVRSWPVEGEVLFSEIMVAPAGGYPEWFELVDVTGEGYELSGCRIERFRLTEEGTIDVGTIQDYVLGADDTEPVIEGGGVVVFGRDCINGTDPEEGGECTHEEYFYGSLSFSNSEAEFVDLYCPDSVGGEVRVDRAGYDVTSTGARSGHSIQFDVSTGEPEDNDAPSAWCEASFDDAYAESGGRGLNYGTPGVNTPCRTGEIASVSAGPGCQCDAGRPASGTAWGLLGLVALGLRRRRS